MSKGKILAALIESGRVSIIPIGSGEGERERKQEGESAGGYTTRFTGAYVCYTCGHLCECGEGGGE